MPSNVNEPNPAILKAESLFYASPHNEGYEKVVYSTLKKIELTCANDYATICSPSSKDALFLDTITKEALNYHKSSGSSRPDDNHGRIDHQDNQSPIPDDPSVVSLGYGDAGDTCLYLNNAKLSRSCQSVVADFHDLKKQYWKEESAANGHPAKRSVAPAPVNVWCSFFAVVAYAVLLSYRNHVEHRRRKMKEMRDTAKGMTDPASNAQRKSYFCDC